MNGRRWKIACINWSFSDAPHALVYALVNGEMVGERYFDTWRDAVDWLAGRLAASDARMAALVTHATTRAFVAGAAE